MKNMIASQKKGNVEMGLNYHNLMEDIVLQHVDRILEADGCCCCAQTDAGQPFQQALLLF